MTLKSVCGYSADDLHSVFSSKACVEGYYYCTIFCFQSGICYFVAGSILSMQTGAVLTTSMSKGILLKINYGVIFHLFF